jgi:tetratricopeptide (TPR) repeat protein
MMRVFRCSFVCRSLRLRRPFFTLEKASPAASDDSLDSALRMLTVDSKKLEEEYNQFREQVQIAETHLEQGRFGEAVAEYEKVARSFSPNHYFGELHLGLGCAFVGLNQPTLAIASFDRALSFDPQSVNAFLNKGLAQTSVGDKRGALETFKKGIEAAQKTSEDMFVAQFRVYCGQLLEELCDDAGALAMYQSIIDSGPDYSQAW